METITGHWDSRDNSGHFLVLCPRMSQHDPSYMAGDNLGQMSRNVPECPSAGYTVRERT